MVLKPIPSGDSISQLSQVSLEHSAWDDFYAFYFASERTNLNPGTIGTSSLPARQSYQLFEAEHLYSFPLGVYQLGRDALRQSRTIADTIWQPKDHHLAITLSASSCINLLGFVLLNLFHQEKKELPFRILSQPHEHSGGIGFFVERPECQLSLLSKEELDNISLFGDKLKQYQPTIFFISSATYDLAGHYNLCEHVKICRQICPDCIIILDVSQQLGVSPIVFIEADFIFSSTHKWLFSLPGLGCLWVHKEITQRVSGLSFNGEALDPDYPLTQFETHGGQSFVLYSALLESLKIYSLVGTSLVYERSRFLCQYFVSHFIQILHQNKIMFDLYAINGILPLSEVQHAESYLGYFSIHFKNMDSFLLYSFLNGHGIHCKCIKKNGYNLLRFGFPYYEKITRLNQALQRVEAYFLQS